MKNFKKFAFFLTLGIFLSKSSFAALTDVRGTNYNFDSKTNLYWLDLTATLNVSHDSIIDGWNGLTNNGWRYASRDELNMMLSNSLPSITKSLVPKNPWDGQLSYGYDSPTDFFAYQQPDKNGEMAQLIQTLGGVTFPSYGATYGMINSAVNCLGCSSGASAISGLGLLPDSNEAFVIGGGAMNNYGFAYIGSFLVHTSPVPEPASYTMLLAGLGLISVKRRHKK